ncbi:AbrB family transcriptional regulator [Clostridium baratii]|uniref:AbrB/MazE/SpoVT family DNA-binding domain-containing protein n=1 Tax=Clostridium baratii TaxID=1561 RepID=UPI0009A26104|nr:AbrB/MazE/SpoVT family DNA-binding domain-containing protein [Clostridium baratii]OPF52046.1 AbrB family transcriptional regulator [Clostridium baratii]OPF54669.1 AbrB family transcriptional regulator [Clostridium baratii]OPF54683.1 AbrB family transcriptional regulator [Clostridium baratii]OPF60944.1 AbrB family transcriptional regulator [Clostridium baratii]
MKDTGIIRRIDELGRIVIPSDLKNKFYINTKDSIAIFVEGTGIILKRYIRGCIFCGEARNTTEFKGKTLCMNCLKEIQTK